MGKGTAGNQRGTVLVTFTLLLTALLGFVALGIEVGTWYVMRAELSKAVDAAALAGAANIASPNLNLVTLAQDFGDANFAPGYLGTASTGTAAASYAVTYNTTQLTVTGSVSGLGIITKMFGITTIPMSATGVAQKNHVQIMLVLDCSGSMAGTPIANLKTAATSFLSFFTTTQSEDQMGLVTFSTAAIVNVPLETNFVSSMQSVINAAKAGGYTNSEDAIAQAGAQLPVQTGTPNASWKKQYIVFMTDGEPTAFRSTFLNQGTPYDAVVHTLANGMSNQWYDVYTYLASPTTGNDLSVNAIPTGNGAANSTCKISEGNGKYLYSTSWATAFTAYPPPSPYTTSYCDSSQASPRTVLAGYIHTTGDQMAIDNAAALKARGVTIYTIGLEGDGGIDTTFLSNVSSGSNYAFVAPNSTQLQAIFNQIAKDITLQLVQ
jgi:Flp pilus assembly protein TadG